MSAEIRRLALDLLPRPLWEWLRVWQYQGRRYGVCETSGGGMGFVGCAGPTMTGQLLGLVLLVLLVGVSAAVLIVRGAA